MSKFSLGSVEMFLSAEELEVKHWEERLENKHKAPLSGVHFVPTKLFCLQSQFSKFFLMEFLYCDCLQEVELL